MRILLDECLPKKLKRELAEFDVMTVADCQWKGKKNGQLLRLAEKQFDLFITIDRGIRYQQNLVQFDLAVITLSAPTNRFESLQPLMAEVKRVIHQLSPGKVLQISA